MSEWWSGLTEGDRTMVRRALAMSADLAVFGFFCAVDNARTIFESPDFTLRLQVVRGDATYAIPAEEVTQLHDIFAALVDASREA